MRAQRACSTHTPRRAAPPSKTHREAGRSGSAKFRRERGRGRARYGRWRRRHKWLRAQKEKQKYRSGKTTTSANRQAAGWREERETRFVKRSWESSQVGQASVSV